MKKKHEPASAKKILRDTPWTREKKSEAAATATSLLTV